MARKKSVRSKVVSPAASAAGRTNVLLEDMQRQLRVVAESVVSLRDELRREAAANHQQLADALAAVSFVVRQHSDDFKEVKSRLGGLESAVGRLEGDVGTLKTDVAELKTDVAVLKTDVAVLKTDVAELKTDVAVLKDEMKTVNRKLDVGLPALDARVNALEAKAG